MGTFEDRLAAGCRWHRWQRAIDGLLRCSECGTVKPEKEIVVAPGAPSALPVHSDENSRATVARKSVRMAAGTKRVAILRALFRDGDGYWTCERFDHVFNWKHQSTSAALRGLFLQGLVTRPGKHINESGNPEWTYGLRPGLREEWDGTAATLVLAIATCR